MTTEATLNRLVITADDFGLAEEVNEAVDAAHRSGILSAASLMVSGPAAADAVLRARKLPALAVGLHIVLVEGRPTLAQDQIPDLVDRTGRLRRDLAKVGVEIACRPAVRSQLRAEIKAQFEAYQQTGLLLSHVDAHKHFHLHPLVAQDIIAIGRCFGMRALRVPSEPNRILARIENGRSNTAASLSSARTMLLQAQARRARLLTPDAVFGWRWSGSFTSKRMVGLLRNLPCGLIEIYCHPATSDDFPGHAEGYRNREEFEALLSPAAMSGLQRSGFLLSSYRDA